MCRTIVAAAVIFGMVVSSSLAFASDDSEVILKILVKKGIVTQSEVDEMRLEIDRERPAEKAQAAQKPIGDRMDAVEKDLLSKVGLDKISSRLKMKARFATGYYDSQKNGSYPNGSFQVPEAKLQFSFLPDDINSVIMRMNLNNAVFNNIDYLYLDTNIMKLTPWEKYPFTLMSRLGKMKIDLGEETWSNNPVEGILPSTSAANVNAYDEGLQLSGKIGKANPLGWAVAITNGNSGTGADNNIAKAFNMKLSYNVIDPLYISGGYYNSGNLGNASADMSIAGLTSPPTNTASWSRQIGEFDIRYDFKKGKVLNPPAYCDSLAFVRFAYGYFLDNAITTTNNISNREGSYCNIEGMYNIMPKLYAAARASAVDLHNGTTASLNSITANSYQRYSIGMGYRLSNAMILKGSYDINVTQGTTGGEEPRSNLLSLIASGQF